MLPDWIFIGNVVRFFNIITNTCSIYEIIVISNKTIDIFDGITRYNIPISEIYIYLRTLE